MELIIQNPESRKWYIVIGMFFVALTIIWGTLVLLKKIGESPDEQKKKRYMNPRVIILGIFLTILATVFFKISISYSLDYSFENIDKSTEYVVELLPANANEGQRIKCADKDEYRFFTKDKELVENVINDFIGHECEIEYYKWSKHVIRVTVID